MKLILMAAFLFAASFSYAQSFSDHVVSAGQGLVTSSQGFDVSAVGSGTTVRLLVAAQCSSNSWSLSNALAYFSSGSNLDTEAPYNAPLIGSLYWNEKEEFVYVSPLSTASFSTNVVAYAEPGEYAMAAIGGYW